MNLNLRPTTIQAIRRRKLGVLALKSYQRGIEPATHALVGWLFWANGPLRQYFSLYRAVSQRERKEK